MAETGQPWFPKFHCISGLLVSAKRNMHLQFLFGDNSKPLRQGKDDRGKDGTARVWGGQDGLRGEGEEQREACSDGRRGQMGHRHKAGSITM